MIALAQSLGFVVMTDRDDATMMNMTLDLGASEPTHARAPGRPTQIEFSTSRRHDLNPLGCWPCGTGSMVGPGELPETIRCYEV